MAIQESIRLDNYTGNIIYYYLYTTTPVVTDWCREDNDYLTVANEPAVMQQSAKLLATVVEAEVEPEILAEPVEEV